MVRYCTGTATLGTGYCLQYSYEYGTSVPPYSTCSGVWMQMQRRIHLYPVCIPGLGRAVALPNTGHVNVKISRVRFPLSEIQSYPPQIQSEGVINP